MTVNTPVYLDHAATTPCDPRVVAAMLPFFAERFGNASSREHAFGWAASAAVDRAREQVAALLGAEPREVVWTSGATEANNLALKGVAEAYRPKGNHLVSCATEHSSVLDPLRRLAEHGWQVTLLPVDRRGRIDLDALRAALRDDTVLVSLMAGNNEIGTVHPIAEIGRLCKERQVLLHCDATQAAGKLPLDVHELGVDLLSLSAHKLHGPKGTGCLWVRRRAPRVGLVPLLDGGGHERGLRSGTLNVPGIVGMGEAAALALEALAEEPARLAALRDELERGIRAAVPDAVVHGDPDRRLPHVSSFGFPGVDGSALIGRLRDVAVSSGAACASARAEPSHVMAALGVDSALAGGTVRFSLGRTTDAEEVAFAADTVVREVVRLRAEDPLSPAAT